MRRLPGPDSPEVLRVSDSSPSSAETSFRELDDVFLQTQTRIWLGEVVQVRFDEEITIADLLADGQLLFEVSKVVWKMLPSDCVGTKFSEACGNEPTAPGKSGWRYMAYSNVDSFLKICKILGLTGVDLFSPSDVVEKGDTRRVCMCIRSLSKKARSKHLSIPDFDVVSYTIAMPTDMVGYIRRTLEQSQCSTSSSIICSRCIHSKRKYKQKIQEVECERHYDFSSEEFDDAESCFRALEFQSPASNASYNVTKNLSSFPRENSPGGDSVVGENFHTPENTCKLDFQNQHKGLRADQRGVVCSEESRESFSSYSMTNGSSQMSNGSIVTSSQQCLGCQNDLNTRPSAHWRLVKYSLSNPEDGMDMHSADFDHCRTCASSVGDSPNELDATFLVDSKETCSGQLCTGSVVWDENLGNCFPVLTSSDSYASLDDMEEEFTNELVVPPGPKLIASHITKDSDSTGSEIGEYEVSSLNSISEEGTVNCEYFIDEKDGFTGDISHLHEFVNGGKKEQSNGNLEISTVDTDNTGKFSSKCGYSNCEITSRNVYRNQLQGIVEGQSNSFCNGFTHSDMSKQDKLCPTFEVCKVMQGLDKELCLEEMFTENAIGFTKNRLGETILETGIAVKSSTEREDRHTTLVGAEESDVIHVKPMSITFKGIHDESVLEPKESIMNHPYVSLSNDISMEKLDCWNPLVDSSDHKEKQQADVSISGNKIMSIIDGDARSMQRFSIRETERLRLEIEGEEFLVGLGDSYLDISHTSEKGPEMPKKVAVNHNCASELIFADSLVDCNSSSCISTVELDCPSAPTLRNGSFSIPVCSKSKSNIDRHSGMCEDDGQNLIDEKDLQSHEPRIGYKDVGAVTDKETENYEKLGTGSRGRDTEKGMGEKHKQKKLLLKSVAGGMTLFGAFFILLHLRKSGKEKIGVKSREQPALSQNHKRSHERPQTGEAVSVYPRERLKFQY